MPPRRPSREDRAGILDETTPSTMSGQEIDEAIFSTFGRADRTPVVRDNSIVVGNFKLTGIGLSVVEEGASITDNDMRQLGSVLRRLEGSLQWLIGDWVVCGDDIYWGQLEQFAQELGFEYATIRDYAYVARNVDLSVRTDKLSFGHHKLVTALPPDKQELFLTQAVNNHWSIAQLREAIKPKALSTSAKPETLTDYAKRWDKLISKRRWGVKEKQEAQNVLDQLEAAASALRHRLSGSDS